MIKTKTISIDEDVHYTAQQTEAKKFRGGFSEYIEQLVKADLKNKSIEIILKPIEQSI